MNWAFGGSPAQPVFKNPRRRYNRCTRWVSSPAYSLTDGLIWLKSTSMRRYLKRATAISLILSWLLLFGYFIWDIGSELVALLIPLMSHAA